jgi:hypothetical protein
MNYPANPAFSHSGAEKEKAAFIKDYSLSSWRFEKD